uniref:Uncharacterized protein n=1 Tax=Meloidogyne enterolobii TaxID=390850 RepID=A0A6V7XSE7_MELEN|nr:unnamed protein product [Meloidogyne enterolobii]
MSLNYIKDPASQVPTLSTGSSGVDSIVRYYQNGTEEVKNLLKNECCVIYECSYCRALFRSIINFIAHKRTICRSLQSHIQAEQLSDVIKNAKEGLTNDQQPENEEIGANGGGNNGNNNNLVAKRNVKNVRALRRFNPVGNIAKHIRPVNVHLEKANSNIEIQTLPKVVRQVAKTTIIDGRQVIEQLPVGMTIKEQIPENRVALVIPRENSTRCGEMQLRRRRSIQLKKLANGGDGGGNSGGNGDAELHELTLEQIAILERIPSAIPVDFVHLRCEDERCTTNGQSSFSMLAALAHHLAIQHQTEYTEEALLKNPAPHIKCYLTNNFCLFKMNIHWTNMFCNIPYWIKSTQCTNIFYISFCNKVIIVSIISSTISANFFVFWLLVISQALKNLFFLFLINLKITFFGIFDHIRKLFCLYM